MPPAHRQTIYELPQFLRFPYYLAVTAILCVVEWTMSMDGFGFAVVMGVIGGSIALYWEIAERYAKRYGSIDCDKIQNIDSTVAQP